MDTSKEYIKMCEKAEEIQKEWKPAYGDLYVWSESSIRRKRPNKNNHFSIVRGWIFGKKNILSAITGLSNEQRHYKEVIWLPRQDQLQKIAFDYLKRNFPSWDSNDKIIGYNFDVSNLLCAFHNFTDLRELFKQSTSMEQLWLAFVMKEKYNKIWTGKEWEVRK